MREKTFFIATLGCRLNQAESGEIAQGLIGAGWRQMVKSEKADLIVVNTCVVTSKAEHETRKMIRGMRRKNPRAFLVVAGCWVNLQLGSLSAGQRDSNREVLEIVDLVVRNEEKKDFLKKIKIRSRIERNLRSRIGIGGTKYAQAKRALVWIQSGCQQFCAYCLVPYVRGPMVNRPVKEVVEKVKQLVRQGIEEIILTGVNLSYWQDGRLKLSGLVKKILRETKIERIRFGSVNLACFDNNFISLFKNPRVCRHVHLPIQSGSDRILKRMKRPYQIADVKRVVERLRKIRGMSVTTDVMVGFPGETRKDFEESLKKVEVIGFDKLHVFSFSKRPGTLATKMIAKKCWEEIDKKTKRARSQKMRSLGRKMRVKFLESQIGKTLPVLFGEKIDGRWRGLSDNYLLVAVNSIKNLQGEIRKVKIVERRGVSLVGKLTIKKSK